MQTNVGMICQNTSNKANFSYSQSSSLNGWLCRRRYSKVYMFDEGVKKKLILRIRCVGRICFRCLASENIIGM